MTRYVGGPLNGEDMDLAYPEGVTEVDVGHPTMHYVKTAPTDLSMGTMLFGTSLSEKVFEWHERGWEPPMVAAIRAAVTERLDDDDDPWFDPWLESD